MATQTRRAPSAAEIRQREAAARERVEQAVRLLHSSLDAIASPGEFAAALATNAHLPRLTFSNAVLARAQRPDVTEVESYDGWLSRGRQVIKGERGIRLLSPRIAPPTGLIDPEGPQRIEGLTTTVLFDVAQTSGSAQGRTPPVSYSEGEIARVLAATPAGQEILDPHAMTAAEMIHRLAQRDARHVDPSTADQVRACTEYMVRIGYGMDGDIDAFGFVQSWDQLPAAARRRQIVEVANQARLAAVALIDLAHVKGIPTDMEAHFTKTRDRIATVATDQSSEQTPSTKPATPAANAAQPAQSRAASTADPANPEVILAANAAAWAYFRNLAATDATVNDYLAVRGITPAPDLPVGYAPPDVRLGAHLRGLGYTDDVQVAAGLARRMDNGRTVDVFRDRVIAPFIDAQGRIVGFTARALHDKGPKYLNTKATAVFTKSSLLYGLTPTARARLAAGATPVLCEGLMDAQAIAQHQPHDIVPIATCGTAFTQDHAADLMETMPLMRIVIAYDGDSAGVAAAIRAGQMLSEDGWHVRNPMPTGEQDPADVAAERGGKVIDWVSWGKSRPALYLAAEQLLATAEHDGTAFGWQQVGARVIDELQRTWGTDDALPDVTAYVGMQTGLHRTSGAAPQPPGREASAEVARAAGRSVADAPSVGRGGAGTSPAHPIQARAMGGAVAHSDRRRIAHAVAAPAGKART